MAGLAGAAMRVCTSLDGACASHESPVCTMAVGSRPVPWLCVSELGAGLSGSGCGTEATESRSVSAHPFSGDPRRDLLPHPPHVSLCVRNPRIAVSLCQ